jgi:hypothetical protein
MRPYPMTLLEKAMKEVHFKVSGMFVAALHSLHGPA